MAELWPMMEFNSIKNPNGPRKIEIFRRSDTLRHVKSHKKISPPKVEKQQIWPVM